MKSATSNSQLSKALSYSEKKIKALRKQLKEELGDRNDISIVAVGSLARREASEFSDLDYYVLTHGTRIGKETKADLVQIVTSVAEKVGIKNPSVDGAFAECVAEVDVTRHIGGNEDNTHTLTRRILLLLESEWLYNERGYTRFFEELINRYVKDTITSHQLCRFLLNDIIRYYRTIGVDFEYKTSVGRKPWGDRNVKLLFSRKLMYFAGILAIAETAQQTFGTKRKKLYELLRMPPVARIRAICGTKADEVLNRYDSFLSRLSTKRFRDMLKLTTLDSATHVAEFSDLKNDGHHFSWHLSLLLTQMYDVSHPLHHALVF